MPDISKVILPNSQEQYNIKDAQARNQISILSNHIIFSKVQPASNSQVAGDIWVVIKGSTGNQQEG